MSNNTTFNTETITQGVVDARQCPCCRQGISVRHRLNSEPVVIVSHVDGHLEAYAESHVNVQLETLPFAGMNAEAELLAEKLFEHRLSRPFRNVFVPRLRTTLGRPLSAKPSDIAAKQHALSILRGLQKFGEDIEV